MVDYFLERLGDEYELIGTDINHDEYVESRIPVFQINDKDSFKVLLQENVHAVIDLVGPMTARMSGYRPDIYVQTNVLGSFQEFQYAVDCHADRILYVRSFRDILERSDEEIVLRADAEPRFRYDTQHSIFTVTRLTASVLLHCMHEYYHIKALVFRLPTFYFWSRDDSYNTEDVLHKIMFRELIDQAT